MMNMTRKRVGLVLMLLVVSVAAFAQTAPFDWGTAAGSLKDDLLTLFGDIWPALAAVFLLFLGIRIVPKLVRRFAK